MDELIIDTTVLSNFAYTDSISELIEACNQNVSVTRAVIEELQEGYEDGYEFLQNAIEVIPPKSGSRSSSNSDFSRVGVVKKDTYKSRNEDKLLFIIRFYRENRQTGLGYSEKEAQRFASRCIDELDWGEATVVAAAYSKNRPLATDDQDARSLAGDFNLDVTGSLGLLAMCVKNNIINTDTANDWLRIWINENSYYSPVSDVSKVLD